MSSRDESEPTTEALETVLQLLKHLDLAGRLTNISPVSATLGSYSNIFRAQYRNTDDMEVTVALKRVRVSLKDDLPLAKVRPIVQ